MIVANSSDKATAEIEAILEQYVPEPVLAFLQSKEQRIVHVSESYTKASPELRRLGVSFEAWPAAPSGLFVVAEPLTCARSHR